MTRYPDHPASLTSALFRLSGKGVSVGSLISIGAGTGEDTLWIARQWPEAKVHLVEAQQEHEPALLAAKRKRANLDYTICAASDSDGEVHFLKSSVAGGAIVSERNQGAEALISKRIDSIVKEKNLHPPYFLKFDTHGAEVPILDGAKHTLAETSLIMMEVYNFKLNFVEGKNLVFWEMCAFLQGVGFRCVDLCDPLFRPNDEAFWQMHLFFIRADHAVFRSNSYKAPKLPD
jgi:FkbM family methyltransferase